MVISVFFLSFLNTSTFSPSSLIVQGFCREYMIVRRCTLSTATSA